MIKKQKNRTFIRIILMILFVLIIAKAYQEKTKKEDLELETRSLNLIFPEAVGFSEKKGSPPRYEVYAINEKGEKELEGLCFLSTDFAPEVRGYSGRIKILIGLNKKGQVKGIKILSHNETPSYVQTLQEPDFIDQFKKLDHKSEFKLGKDLDGIARATITSRAVVLSVEKSVKLAAGKYFNLEVKQSKNIIWKEIFKDHNLYIIILFFILAMYYYLNGIRYGRYFILTGAIIYFGFLELNYISIIGLINIFTGRIPDIISSISWYLLFIFTFITTIFWGRIYCGWICPFGAIQDILGKISPFHVKMRNKDEKNARLIKYYLLIITVGAVFFTGNIGFTKYEPFNTIFRLNGEILIYTFIIFLLFCSFFVFRFWCRYLCGVGAFLSLLSNLSIFPLKAKKECSLCKKCETECPLEICDVNDDVSIDKGECIQCNICREECAEKSIGHRV